MLPYKIRIPVLAQTFHAAFLLSLYANSFKRPEGAISARPRSEQYRQLFQHLKVNAGVGPAGAFEGGLVIPLPLISNVACYSPTNRVTFISSSTLINPPLKWYRAG